LESVPLRISPFLGDADHGMLWGDTFRGLFLKVRETHTYAQQGATFTGVVVFFFVGVFFVWFRTPGLCRYQICFANPPPQWVTHPARCAFQLISLVFFYTGEGPMVHVPLPRSMNVWRRASEVQQTSVLRIWIQRSHRLHLGPFLIVLKFAVR